jgi:uncharacterized membrane protein
MLIKYKYNQMENVDLDGLESEQGKQLDKLHQIVENTFKEEKLIINNLLNPPKEVLTRGQSISDKVARFGGSWKFIIVFGIMLFVWITYNAIVPGPDKFDPFPFILMNLILSCIAALQAPVIMMSQNRQEEKDRQRGENDYMINMKAEMEIRSLHQKVDLLLEDQIKTLYDMQTKQFALLKDLNDKLEILSNK